MTELARTPVTVLGLGSMGRAFAEAFVAAGHSTTVWNRTAAKAEPLVAAGATYRESIADAVAASPLIIACLTTFRATADSLAPVETLAGRTLVTLNSGTPGAAREMAEWAAARGGRFLGGAIKNVPTAVGKPDTLLYYGGDRAVFDEHEPTLRVLGGDTRHLGEEPDLAALYESAVGATLLPALLGFLQGAAVLAARGYKASTMVDHEVKWLQMIESILPVLADEIDTVDYTKLGSSVNLFHAAIDDEAEIGAETAIDMSWHAPMHDLLRRAVAEGYGEQSITSLIELLRKPA
ncbi:NAD(P)-dependent oxidoreductase [Nocardia mexicana]|uniref:3-hydroxyisobutyrate dehydrogenase-like beta-hydroxyacid dehydrogenase n=1 Tax=Nocardia mexicana TaxID=279262 RepID=A0A370GGL6_9NOCA|nr:NAD(P)-binding domain-containing protein [Nocardia mexicana]RDI42932.1 3-hydroxyisobutyrate dehydrogenase-like beta-hydroxyacid dehydrogenase [Nocardia mexicana]